MKFTILRFDSIDSTNTAAATQARNGAAEGLCILAGEQTAGRGRHGRTWVSNKGAGLYLSIVLRPRFDSQFLPLITLMTGVAVHDALREFGVASDIKWVNDLLVNDTKISGILAETVETPTGLAVIVGIGVNLSIQETDTGISDSITSIESNTGCRHSADDVAEAVTRYLSHFYGFLDDENGRKYILQKWRQRSTYFHGKAVSVTLAGSVFEGVTDGLEENGALRVKTSDGLIKIVQAGDVERLREDVGNCFEYK